MLMVDAKPLVAASRKLSDYTQPPGLHQSVSFPLQEQLSPATMFLEVLSWVLKLGRSIVGRKSLAKKSTYTGQSWLVQSDQDTERVATMARTLFQFGYGRFNCIGQNISLLEMVKLVPSFLRTFQISLYRPDDCWKFESGAFANVDGVDIVLKTRGS
jgi:hypothetical protein